MQIRNRAGLPFRFKCAMNERTSISDDNSVRLGLSGWWIGVVAAAIMAFLAVSEPATAQFESTWLDVGEFQSIYWESGSGYERGRGNRGVQWPAIQTDSDGIRSSGFLIGVKNWTDPQGNQHDYHVDLLVPRDPGESYVCPVKHEVVSSLGTPDNPKDSQPRAFVNGAFTFDKVSVVDRVDPDMKADKMLHTVANYRTGIRMERKIYSFGQEYHDQYHIQEYLLTNTGNADCDEEIEMPDQTLNEVYFYWAYRDRGDLRASWVTGGGQVWGKYNMVDVVGDGHQEYKRDFRSAYTWPGWAPDFSEYNSLGEPIVQDAWWGVEGDTTGRLGGASTVGRATLFADGVGNEGEYSIEEFPPPESEDADLLSSRDPTERQPHYYGYQNANGRVTSPGEPMIDYYQVAIQGQGPEQGTKEHWADIVEPDGNFATTTGDPSAGQGGGWHDFRSYGPYNLDPGESVRIVRVVSVGGLKWDAKVQIGRAYKRSGFQDSLHIEYDANGDGEIQGTSNDVDGSGGHSAVPYDESLTKNRWVLTSIDSLFQQFERAEANYRSEFDIPQPPLPPQEFRVNGRPDQVELSWSTYSSGSGGGDHPQPEEWEIYRTSDRVDNLPYQKIATVPASARSYEDTELQRGLNYYYYIQAVGPELGSAGPAGTPAGVRLRSDRYYTQTYAPVQLKRPPGETVASFEVVPNPFNLESDPSVRWPGQRDKLGFLDIPGECTITIFTETGEHVHTIEHTDGSGDEFWNMTTEARQLLVSGVYYAVVEDHQTGKEEFRKFMVIR